jgi:hypothetical protein
VESTLKVKQAPPARKENTAQFRTDGSADLAAQLSPAAPFSFANLVFES